MELIPSTIHFNEDQMDSLLSYTKIRDILQLFNLIKKLDEMIHATLYEILLIRGNWDKKDRILPKLFEEIFAHFKEIVPNICSNFDKILNEFKTEYTELKELIDPLYLLKYLTDQFEESFDLHKLKKKHFSEYPEKEIHYSTIFSAIEFPKTIRRCQMRFLNNFRDINSKLKTILDSICTNLFYDRIAEFLKMSHVSNHILKAESFLNLYQNLFYQSKLFESEFKDLFMYNYPEFALTPFFERNNAVVFTIREKHYPNKRFGDYYIIIDIDSNESLESILEKSEYTGEIIAYFFREPNSYRKIHNSMRDHIHGKVYGFFHTYENYFPREFKKIENKFLVIDLETTSLRVNEALIVEIGIVEYDLNIDKIKPIMNMIVKDKRFSILNEGSQIFRISNLTSKDIEKAIDIDYIYPFLQNLFSCYQITSFPTSYDLTLLRYYRFTIPYELPCLMLACKPILKLPHEYYGTKYPSLSEAYSFFFKKDLTLKHRAFNDAYASAEILRELIKNHQYPK